MDSVFGLAGGAQHGLGVAAPPPVAPQPVGKPPAAAVSNDFATAGGVPLVPTRSMLSVREKLTVPRTYFVRTDGSDSNNGLVNSAAGAFLTIQHAVDVASGLDNGGNDVTISIIAGTYTGATTLKSFVGTGKILIVGDETTPANVLISVTGGSCFSATAVLGTYALRGLKMTTTTSGYGLLIQNTSTVEFQNVDFGVVAASHILCYSNSTVTATGNYTISGGAVRHLDVSKTGIIAIGGITVTLTGTPNFSSAYVFVNNLGSVNLASDTYVGSATGTRYNIQTNGVVDTAGGAAPPGSVAGTTATGGQFV